MNEYNVAWLFPATQPPSTIFDYKNFIGTFSVRGLTLPAGITQDKTLVNSQKCKNLLFIKCQKIKRYNFNIVKRKNVSGISTDY